MSGFKHQGIKHLSCSSLNLAQEAIDVWVSRYLFGNKGTYGAAAQRGIAVEDAVVQVLALGADIDEAIASATKAFNAKFPLALDDKTIKERDVIAPMVKIAVEELEQYGKPEFPDHGGQHKVTRIMKCGDWEIPVIGYLDLVYPQHGLIVDLKTTNRIPSIMSAPHRRQRCFYARCEGNKAVKFLYVSKAKAKWLEGGNIKEEMAIMKAQAMRLEKFLSLGDRELLRSIVPVNPNTFYWNGEENTRKELYGI